MGLRRHLAALALVGAADAAVRVACLGDSITKGGHGSDEDDDDHADSYPEFLGALLGDGYDVRNYGSSGKTAADYGTDESNPYRETSNWDDALDDGFDIAVVMLGTNDAKRDNWDRDTFVAQYGALLAETKARAAALVALLPVPYVPGDEFSASGKWGDDPSVMNEALPAATLDAFEEDGAAPDVVVSLWDAFGGDDPDLSLYDDAIHPNQKGYERIAETVYAEGLLAVRAAIHRAAVRLAVARAVALAVREPVAAAVGAAVAAAVAAPPAAPSRPPSPAPSPPPSPPPSLTPSATPSRPPSPAPSASPTPPREESASGATNAASLGVVAVAVAAAILGAALCAACARRRRDDSKAPPKRWEDVTTASSPTKNRLLGTPNAWRKLFSPSPRSKRDSWEETAAALASLDDAKICLQFDPDEEEPGTPSATRAFLREVMSTPLASPRRERALTPEEYLEQSLSGGLEDDASDGDVELVDGGLGDDASDGEVELVRVDEKPRAVDVDVGDDFPDRAPTDSPDTAIHDRAG
ncbi:GDSL-like Lipase/Acylhydrolase [Aureococcus anophagefferens]|nr:GDSL-like Lipase/Acylhydrolase [Aureococcus anophagefferens]